MLPGGGFEADTAEEMAELMQTMGPGRGGFGSAPRKTVAARKPRAARKEKAAYSGELRDPGGAGRSLASTDCAVASSEFWFVGGGAIAGRRTQIVLVNPDENAAIVDLIIRGPDGIIDAPAGRGLVVPGQDRLVVRLDVLAPGVPATAVQVLARTGRVGAAVDDEQRSV